MFTFIPEKNWAKFEQELPSIMCVIGFTTWWQLNIPSVIPPGNHYRIMCIVLSNMVNIGCIIYSFSFPDETAPFITLSFFNELPGGSTLKKIFFILVSVEIFYLWHTDFYHTSNINYVIALAMCVLTYILLYRSVHRSLLK